MLNNHQLEELQSRFKDVLNYSSEDPLEPINPLTYRTPEGDSCLHLAVLRGDRRAIELLLNAGLNVNDIGDMGFTPLHYAYMVGFDDIVQMLIEHGADQNIINEFGDKPHQSKRPK
jgi:ankyrin repeat protein